MVRVLSLTKDMSNASSFAELLAPHQSQLYRLAYRLTGSEADSHDLMQDVLLKLYLQRNTLAEIERLRPWLAKVLFRTFLDGQRRNQKSPLRLVHKELEEEGSTIEEMACPQPSPDQQLETEGLHGQLKAAVQRLNNDQRAVCILHDMEGYTLPELAEIMATPIGTLKSRLHRARTRLKKILSTPGGFIDR